MNLPFVFCIGEVGVSFCEFWNSDRLGDFPLTW